MVTILFNPRKRGFYSSFRLPIDILVNFAFSIAHEYYFKAVMIKLLIVEDFPILTEGLIRIFKTIPEIEIIGITDNARQCIQFLKKSQPDVILLDLMLCSTVSMKMIEDIRRLRPNSGILLLTINFIPNLIKNLKDRGINGCLLKNTCPDEIINAIRAIANGKTYFGEELRNPGINGDSKTKCISRREMEVLNMIAEGMTNYQIADKLNISPLTVDSHRKNLIIKLGAKNTASLIKLAMEQGHL